MKTRFGITVAATVYACGLAGALIHSTTRDREARATLPLSDVPPAIVADAGQVQRSYERHRAKFLYGPRAGQVAIPFTWSKGLCDGPKGTTGEVVFDFRRGVLHANAEQLATDVDLWLVENVVGEGRSVAPEPGDRYSRIGTLFAGGDTAIRAGFDELVGRDLRPDLVLVTPAGSDPESADALAVGLPGLFDRLVMREQTKAQATRERTGLPLAVVGPMDFTLGVISSPDPMLEELVAIGEDLFFNETFEGNERTCGTCHPASNNLTIDKAFIDTLPPDDPLFVAEFIPELIFEENGERRFEHPELMREFGLIVENLDGFGDLTHRFVLRAVSHVFAQGASITRPEEEPGAIKDRTGWGGDGSPGNGTLREFAIGAVRQHFTRTMNRQPGADFRFPTDFELDALEAFQLALGRQDEYDLDAMEFTDEDAEQGRVVFVDICGRCHVDGGANSIATQAGPTVADILPEGITDLLPPIGNGRFNTAVEKALFNLGEDLTAGRPIDGGFGVTPQGGSLEDGEVIANTDGSFGDRTFNIQSVVEFADTAPGFHNHLTALTDFDPDNGGPGEPTQDHVEAAVRFYTTPEFLGSPGASLSGGPLLAEVPDIARFLRAINAVQNARDATRYLERALQLEETFPSVALNAVELAYEDCLDGLQVLEGAADLNPLARSRFHNAKTILHDTALALDAGAIPSGDLVEWLTEPLQDLANAQGMIFETAPE